MRASNGLRVAAAAFLLLCTLAGAAHAGQITVAAAADLNYVMKDLASRYERKTGNKVVLAFGASGNFYSQIRNGAPYDVFFSADEDYPKQLVQAGLLAGNSLQTYAVGQLVLWVPNETKLDPQRLRIDLLLRPAVRKIAIANPAHAPYGRAAMAALEHFEIKNKVEGKLVLGENIAQAAEFVMSGNAQAALIAEALAVAPPMKNAGRYWRLPEGSYPEIKQDAAILASSPHKQAAQEFIEFVTSKQGKAILQQYGFE